MSVYISPCSSYDQAKIDRSVRGIFDTFMNRVDFTGKQVVIKPNLLMARNPDTATTTHPTLIVAAANEVLRRGGHVTIADSPGGPYNTRMLKNLYRSCGLADVFANTAVTLNYDTSSHDVPYTDDDSPKSVPIITPILDADIIINIAKMKTHGFAFISGAVKNLFGVIPGLTKPMYHAKYPGINEFSDMLIDLCDYVRPTLSIIDGVVGMEGKGPSGGRPKHAGVILGGIDPYALDMVMAHMMGFDPNQCPTIVRVQKRGKGPKKLSDITITGASIDDFCTHFIPPMDSASRPLGFLPKFLQQPMQRLLMPYPHIDNTHCTGCGDCARTCPQHIITIENKKAVISYHKCIKCYCCHELCPIRAIEFKRFVKKQAALK